MDRLTDGAERQGFTTPPILEETGFVELKKSDDQPEAREWRDPEYLDWTSGGDTNFAILASAHGDHDPRGFLERGKPDKGGVWLKDNIEKAPNLRRWVESVGANYGRVRIIKLEPNTYEDAIRSLHRDDNNRMAPEGNGFVVRAWLQLTDDPRSYMILRENKDDLSTESRILLLREGGAIRGGLRATLAFGMAQRRGVRRSGLRPRWRSWHALSGGRVRSWERRTDQRTLTLGARAVPGNRCSSGRRPTRRRVKRSSDA